MANTAGLRRRTVADAAKPPYVVVVGASHIQQWHFALELLAVRNGWQLSSYLLPGCDIYPDFAAKYPPWTDANVVAACLAFLNETYAEIASNRPDVVVVLATYVRMVPSFVSPGGTLVHGHLDGEVAFSAASPLYQQTRGVLLNAGTRLVALRDTPWATFAHNPAKCVAKLGDDDDVRRCAFRPTLFRDAAVAEAKRNHVNETFIDMLDAFCPCDGSSASSSGGGSAAAAAAPCPISDSQRNCSAVIGNVLVYYDGVGHMTHFYSRTLANVLESRLRAASLPLPFRPISHQYNTSRPVVFTGTTWSGEPIHGLV